MQFWEYKFLRIILFIAKTLLLHTSFFLYKKQQQQRWDEIILTLSAYSNEIEQAR